MIRFLGVFGLVAALGLVGAGRADDEKKQAQDEKKAGKRFGAKAPDLAELFKKLDADGDGKLSMEEFKKLPELYKPALRPGGLGGGLDGDGLKKLLERFGGAGGIDPDQLKKLIERFKGKKGGAFDLDGIQKLLEGFGGAGGFDPDQLKKLLERAKGAQGNDPEKK